MSATLIRIALALLLLCAVAAPVCAKPAPPAGLMKIFTTFLQGEESIEEDEWGDIAKWLDGLDKEYQSLRPVIVKALPPAEVDHFEKSLAAFRSGTAGRNHNRTHDDFLTLHKAFLDLLDEFDYKAPPLMYLVQNDLTEVSKALNEGELDEVQDEIGDVEHFYALLIPALRARGVGETLIGDFKAQLIRCKGALAANDTKLFRSEFAKLQQLFAAQNRLLSGN